MNALNHVPSIEGAAGTLQSDLNSVPGAATAFAAYSAEVNRAVAALQDRVTMLERQMQELRKLPPT
jgi:ubiquinone biosynthesis protein UbiJ